jgi:hypothetical protein
MSEIRNCNINIYEHRSSFLLLYHDILQRNAGYMSKFFILYNYILHVSFVKLRVLKFRRSENISVTGLCNRAKVSKYLDKVLLLEQKKRLHYAA